jgi:TonB family protein
MFRGAFTGGLVLTALIHGALAAAVFLFHLRREPAREVARDLMVTRMIQLGKPREKFWLPRLVQPPRPRAPAEIRVTDDPSAPMKAAPKPEDQDVSQDLKRALEKARALALTNVPEEPPEGSLTGSASGTSSEASLGDEYATAIFEAIRKNWTVPQGLDLGDVARLTTEIRVSIGEDGTLRDPQIKKSSENQLFDDSCMQALLTTRKVPPPPAKTAAAFRRGTVLEFVGKDLAR